MSTVNYIFLVEDDPDDVMLFRDAAFYIDSKVRIDHATTCDAAIEMLESNTILPDIIVLDFNLPGTSGKECLQRLRHLESTKNIPIIFLSTSDCPYTKAETIKLGAIDFVTKPPRFIDLVRFIHCLIKGQPMQG